MDDGIGARPPAAKAPGRGARLKRRRLLGSALGLAGLAALAGARSRAEATLPTEERALRPPGARAERDFLAACIRCGLCVQACPWHTLRLAGASGPFAPGTPWFRAREVPCEMCRDIPCVAACPSGALQPALGDIADARIGLAGLTRPEGCYSFIGAARCDSCARACPLQGRAIRLQPGRTRLGGSFTPTVDPAACTGCGKCERACIAALPAITVQAYRDGRLGRRAV